MKKSNCLSVIVLSMISLFALASVHASVDVYPTWHAFGDVEVGTSVSTIVSISNYDTDRVEIKSIGKSFTPID